jgi:hypothetical protein
MALTKIRGNTQVQDLSITNAQISLPDPVNPDGILLSKIQDGSLLIKSDGSVPFTTPISGVTPSQNGHLATKEYVDAQAQGLDVKLSVRAVATTSIPMSGTQTVDGVSLNVGDRVLLAGQSNSVQNGIYIVAAGGWTRSPDATTAADVTPGLFTFVEEGNANAGTGWVLTSTGTTVLGTTPLPFAQFSTAGVVLAGTGLAKTGNTLNVVSSNGGIVASSDAIALTLDGPSLTVGPAGLKLSDLPEGQVLIGSGANVATPRTISGDITIDSAGVARIVEGAVNATSIADGTLGLSKLAGGTTGQLIVIGDSGTPSYVTISGAATVSGTGQIQLSTNSVGTTQLVNASVTLPKLVTIPAGRLLIGTSGGNATVALSGDVTINEAGVVTVNPATVVRVADIVKGEVPTGAIDGVNDTFVLAHTPRAGTVELFINGVLQDAGAGNDYTVSGTIITTLYLLTPGDKIRVSYFKA